MFNRFLNVYSGLLVLLSTSSAQAADTDFHFSHDFGEVSGTNQVAYQFKLSNTNNETVKTIFRTCGCTTLNLSEGDVLPTNDIITVAISLEGKSFGKGNQVVGIETADGKYYHFDLAYTYFPDPFSNPIAVVFSSRSEKKQIQLFFPKEENIKFIKHESQKALFTVTPIDSGPHFILIEIAPVNDKKADSPQESFSVSRLL